MRHFYTTMLAAAIATASFAQPTTKTHSLIKAQSTGIQVNSPVRQQLTKLPEGAKKTNLRLPDFTGKNTSAMRMKKASSLADLPLIKELPEGTHHTNYYGSTTGYTVFWGEIFSSKSDGTIQDFVTTDNGDVYLHNAMSSLLPDTWIKGTKTVGDTIAFNFPQKYLDQEETDDDNKPTGNIESFYLWRMVINKAGDSFIPDPTSQTIKYVLRNDSLIRVDDFKNGISLGLATEDGEWVGYNDFLSTWFKVKDPVVTLPASAKPETFQADFWNNDGQEDSRILNIAVDGNDMYLGNLIEGLPDAWVKGEIKGDKVVFNGKTYLGVDKAEGYHAYFTPVGVKKVYNEFFDDMEDSLYFINNIEYDYDAAAKTIKNDSATFAINAGKNEVLALRTYEGAAMKPWTEIAGRPMMPTIYDFMEYDDDYGYGGFQVYLEKNSVDGNFLNPAKLYYNVFFDEEKFTFYTDEYQALEEDITDLPYDFADNWDIYNYGSGNRAIYFYTQGFATIGVQEFYKDGDKEYRSDMALYTVNEDGSLTGINNANVDDMSKTVKGISYTDLSGRTISKPNKGICMKTVKFADGSQKTIKFVRK